MTGKDRRDSNFEATSLATQQSVDSCKYLFVHPSQPKTFPTNVYRRMDYVCFFTILCTFLHLLGHIYAIKGKNNCKYFDVCIT
jgi:hypothetical protein